MLAGAIVAVAFVVVSGGLALLGSPASSHTVPERLLWGARPGVTLAGITLTGRTAAEITAVVESMRPLFALQPVDATVTRLSGEVLPERDGVALDVEGTVATAMSASEGDAVPVRVRPVAPRVRASDIRGLKRPAGVFSTVVAGSRERRENVRLAARYVNNTVIAQGDTFSFLETLGPVTYVRGFVDAPVIVGEEFVDGPGGGICQVSTTVYNSALKAGLNVVERHRHSKPVGYVPEGMDATVASWGLDLKIRNGFEHPVMLLVESGGDRVTARFLFP
ncbi:MAG: VanW family protein [Firmicutes bacterium]|nr:VanW family protein [Bacillota bacterium]